MPTEPREQRGGSSRSPKTSFASTLIIIFEIKLFWAGIINLVFNYTHKKYEIRN